MKDINELLFPEVQEGEKVFYNEIWYVYTNGTWVEENN
jgi:hypothetical protein